jgi:hypothetical protein
MYTDGGQISSGKWDVDVKDILDEGTVGKSENGLRRNSGGDEYAESILLLQRAQESLENGMSEFSPSLSSFINQFLNSLFIMTNVACQLSI